MNTTEYFDAVYDSKAEAYCYGVVVGLFAWFVSSRLTRKLKH